MIQLTVHKTSTEVRILTAAIAALQWRASRSGTFEPWLAGDRQMPGGVAKPHCPEANGLFEVSLS
jgi:hypothetical protein